MELGLRAIARVRLALVTSWLGDNLAWTSKPTIAYSFIF